MMYALAAHGAVADMVVGSSVGALNGAYYAGVPTLDGVKHLADIWCGLRRQDVFPVSIRTLLGFLWRRDFLIIIGNWGIENFRRIEKYFWLLSNGRTRFRGQNINWGFGLAAHVIA